MARLVDVVRGAGGEHQTCAEKSSGGLVKIPLVIESQLSLSLALPEVSPAGEREEREGSPDLETFLSRYRSLSRAEVSSSLEVSREEVASSLTSLVTCLGCRTAVENLHTDLASHNTSLGSLSISSSGEVSLARELRGEARLAALLSRDLGRLEEEVGGQAREQERGARRGKGRGRCALHSLDTKKRSHEINWLPTWNSMEQKVREEVVLLPFLEVRKTLDEYLKRHKFCSDCTFMLNRAYFFLMSEGEMTVKTTCPNMKTFLSDHANLYPGISACPLVKYIYVQSDQAFLTDFYNLIEHELIGLTDTRHAKTLELAQKEILIVIGLTLFERFKKIQQKVDEAEQTYKILHLTLLKTLRTSFDLTADKKRGDRDMELLCQELELEEKRKEKKKEKKKNKRAKKKEENSCVTCDEIGEGSEKQGGNSTVGDSGECLCSPEDQPEPVEAEEPEVLAGCSVFCERDHSESRASKENCGNARKVRQGWLTSEALSAPAVSGSSKKKTKKQKQRNSTGDSGFSSEVGRDRKDSLSTSSLCEALEVDQSWSVSGLSREASLVEEKREEKREERCSVFCKLGSSPVEPGESFPHTVCLAEWLTAQYVQNPDIDLFSAFFLGINF